MRTFFEPEQQEEFKAAQELMVRRFAAWAGQQGLPADPWVAEAAWDYRHADTPDGRLTLWSPVHVREFLLEWMPRRLMVQPGEELPDGPGTLAALLRYFDETGLRDPRGGTLAANQAALETAAGQFRAAMADRELWGTAKFWATTAADYGVDITDPHALRRFSERAQRGQVPCDEALAGRIMQRRFDRGPFAAGLCRSCPWRCPRWRNCGNRHGSPWWCGSCVRSPSGWVRAGASSPRRAGCRWPMRGNWWDCSLPAMSKLGMKVLAYRAPA
ncbi:hypothetical protein [Streptomyces sp. NPDC001774]